MVICRNVVEELVIEEANLQLERLSKHVQEQLRLADIVCQVLNHLPTMYATNHRGWIKQRSKAKDEYGKQINVLVQQAIVTMSNSPLRNVEPLPLQVLASPERSLDRLQKIIRKTNLTWADIPNAVIGAIVTAYQSGHVASEPQSPSRTPQSAAAKSIKSYLQRHARKDEPKIKAKEIKDEFEQEFQRYMLRANCGFVNVLEGLVLEACDRQIQRLDPSYTRPISLEEVAAYALNRLPPLYATSEHGYRELRLRVKNELKADVIEKIREGIIKLTQSPMRKFLPPPFEKIDHQRDEAIAQLQTILQEPELTWEGLPEQIADILRQTREGNQVWFLRVRAERGAVS
ncbi:MAG: late competence development ComFB family protein [Pseudanabaenaceae cyanobacterium bins.68]|nr:late competence development ComFB family protein [Pseudanabaenaceae cyanobacterium bins.68]